MFEQEVEGGWSNTLFEIGELSPISSWSWCSSTGNFIHAGVLESRMSVEQNFGEFWYCGVAGTISFCKDHVYSQKRPHSTPGPPTPKSRPVQTWAPASASPFSQVGSFGFPRRYNGPPSPRSAASASPFSQVGSFGFPRRYNGLDVLGRKSTYSKTARDKNITLETLFPEDLAVFVKPKFGGYGEDCRKVTSDDELATVSECWSPLRINCMVYEQMLRNHEVFRKALFGGAEVPAYKTALITARIWTKRFLAGQKEMAGCILIGDLDCLPPSLVSGWELRAVFIVGGRDKSWLCVKITTRSCSRLVSSSHRCM